MSTWHNSADSRSLCSALTRYFTPEPANHLDTRKPFNINSKLYGNRRGLTLKVRSQWFWNNFYLDFISLPSVPCCKKIALFCKQVSWNKAIYFLFKRSCIFVDIKSLCCLYYLHCLLYWLVLWLNLVKIQQFLLQPLCPSCRWNFSYKC